MAFLLPYLEGASHGAVDLVVGRTCTKTSSGRKRKERGSQCMGNLEEIS